VVRSEWMAPFHANPRSEVTLLGSKLKKLHRMTKPALVRHFHSDDSGL
jgi:hypothetical protein